MNEMKKEYELKQFFMNLYSGSIISGNNLVDDEYIRLLQKNAEGINETYFNNIDDLLKYILSNNKFYYNSYFQLSSTSGLGGNTSNLKYRNMIALDFDKSSIGEKLTLEDIVERFKSKNIYYHAIVDSGNGYHVYMYIKKTNDYELIKEVTMELAKKLGADLNACKSTQLLRVPYTYNIKDLNNKKSVNLVYQTPKDKIIRYDISKLHRKYCKPSNLDTKTLNNINIEKTLNLNIKLCVDYILCNGSEEHNNNCDLQKIIIELRSKNKSLEEIQRLCNDWNRLNKVSWSQSELDYQTKYMYEKLITTKYNCENCKNKEICTDAIIYDFEFDDKVILFSEKDIKSLKRCSRRGVKVMESNDFIVYGILKNHNDGMYRDELIKELTYKSKCLFSEPTLSRALNNLEKNKFINVMNSTNNKKFYTISQTKNKPELTFKISVAAIYECIKRSISIDELSFYCYMRYLHNKEQRENIKALKGNLFQMNQRELGGKFGVTQQRVSQMIESLEKEKLISIYYRTSKNNGYEYYVYRLNY